MNKTLCLLSLLSCLALPACSACNAGEQPTPPNNNPNPQTPKPEPPTAPTTNLADYFKTTLDTEDIPYPDQSLYKQSFGIDELQAKRGKIWGVWREANAERIKKHLLFAPYQAEHDIIWSLTEGERMKLRLFAKGQKPQEGYAMFINLHGGGKAEVPNEWGSTMNDEQWKTAIALGKAYNDTGSIYLVPRMADDRKGRWYLAPQRIAFRRACQLAMLGEDVDPLRIYMTGISEGGYGSHRLAIFMPDFFAAIGPMAGAEPLKGERNLRNVAFHLSVGELDHGFGRSKYAQEWKQKLAELKTQNPDDFVHEVQIRPRRGHSIDYFRTTPWLAKHKRRIYPERISYLYYNMTADYPTPSYSPGVYYLDFRKLSHNGSSLLFEISKQGNTYDVATVGTDEKVTGELGIYIDQVDFSKPIMVRLNGKEVYNQTVALSEAYLAESTALWGDPKRLFAAKVTIKIK